MDLPTLGLVSNPLSPGSPTRVVLSLQEEGGPGSAAPIVLPRGAWPASLGDVGSRCFSAGRPEPRAAPFLSVVTICPFLFLVLQDDEDEEAPGPSRQPLRVPLQRSAEEEAHLARPTLVRSSSSSDQSEMVGPKPEALPRSSAQAQAACRTPRPHPSPPGPGLDWQLLHAHVQQTEAFQQFCQELVTVHRDMANSMHAIGQTMAELTSRVGQMCQTLTEIRDGVQASQRGPGGVAPVGSTPQAEAPPAEPPQAPPAPAPARTTRSRKRKHNF